MPGKVKLGFVLRLASKTVPSASECVELDRAENIMTRGSLPRHNCFSPFTRSANPRLLDIGLSSLGGFVRGFDHTSCGRQSDVHHGVVSRPW